MADQVLTDRTELTTSASGDFLHIVDVSDLTDGAAGTSKKIQKSNIIPTSNKGIVETSSVFGLGDGELINFVWDALASASNTNGANFTFNDLQIILEKLSTTSGNGAKIDFQETLLQLEQGNNSIKIDKVKGIHLDGNVEIGNVTNKIFPLEVVGGAKIEGTVVLSDLLAVSGVSSDNYMLGNLAIGTSNNEGFNFLSSGGAKFKETVIISDGYTVATLPTGVVGMRAYVTDATTPTYLGALTGGGAVTCPVFFDGTNWIS
jgi:hypothetical protein